jgi:hypothetical protein
MPGGLWQRGIIEATRTSTVPHFRGSSSIDPGGLVSEHADETGIIAAGRTRTGMAMSSPTPRAATRRRSGPVAIAAYGATRGRRIVAESTMAAMVEATLRMIIRTCLFSAVRAARGRLRERAGGRAL